jgi:hypothetical protein
VEATHGERLLRRSGGDDALYHCLELIEVLVDSVMLVVEVLLHALDALVELVVEVFLQALDTLVDSVELGVNTIDSPIDASESVVVFFKT